MEAIDQQLRVASGLAPFCGVRQSLIEEARRSELKWSKRELAWCIADRIPGIPVETLTAVYAAAWGAWAAVCDLRFQQVAESSRSDIVHLTRAIDGRSGTLAEAELPPGDDRRLRMWIDIGDRWHADSMLTPPTQGDLTDLLAVVSHEGGHNLGLSHEPSARVTALMDPFYNRAIRKPQAWDIEEVQRRYGRPSAANPPTGVIPVPKEWPDKFEGVCEIFGGVYKIRFDKAL